MEAAPRTPHRRVLVVATIALTAFESFMLLIIYAAWAKPLLYDEFVYYAAGGLSGTAETWQAIRETTTNLNQGATGVFILVDHLLLDALGASTVALRLPGLLAAGFLLATTVTFLVLRKAPLWILPLVPWVFATQELVMRYVGEARSYMPLAAGAVGILTYYSLSREQRRSWWGRTIGWVTVLMGVLFHPYFSVYWIALLLFAYLVWGRGERIVVFANPLLVTSGAFLYLVLGAMTWARGKADAAVDPFNFLPGPLPIEVMAQNLYFLIDSRVALLALLSLLVVWVGVTLGTDVPASTLATVLMPPLALAALSFVLSLGLSLTTIISDFWIFPRQWIASVALITIAVTWGFGEWAALLTSCFRRSRQGRMYSVAFVAVSTVLVIAAALPSVVTQLDRVTRWSSRALDVTTRQPELADLLDSRRALTDPEWIEFAQNNLDVGGEVWPEFGRYYTDVDWTSFRLVDGSSPD